MKNELLTLMRFSTVGILATLVHYCVALTLLWYHAFSAQQANLTAFLVAFLFSFFCHGRFTFRSNRSPLSSGPRFLLTSGGAYLVSAAALRLMELGTTLPETMQLVLAAGIIPACTYLAGRFWVFK